MQIAEVLGKQLEEERLKREEREQIKLELAWEEERNEEREKDREEKEKILRNRIQMQEDYRRQMAYKRVKEEANLLEEAEFSREMMEKFAEDDKLEQINSNKRRMKQQEHKRAVQKLLEDRRKRFAEEQEKKHDEYKEAQEMERSRREII